MPDCQSKVRITSSPRFTKRSFHKMRCCSQRLPDTAASTLLRLLKPGLMQILPHHDIDMWGRVWMSCFRRVWQSLNFDIEYLFGSETSLCFFRDLIYARTACNSPKSYWLHCDVTLSLSLSLTHTYACSRAHTHRAWRAKLVIKLITKHTFSLWFRRDCQSKVGVDHYYFFWNSLHAASHVLS